MHALVARLVLEMNVQPLRIMVWNVRGLNAPARQNAVFQVVNQACPAIVCLQETKLHDVSLSIERQGLGAKFVKFFYLPTSGTRGGILVAWDATITQLSNLHYTNHTLTVLVK